jgi:hypothetical protein
MPIHKAITRPAAAPGKRAKLKTTQEKVVIG